MTRRERMERRLERRQEWAKGRQQKAASLRAVDEHLRHDWAFITQPGRIPARERMNRRDERAYEHGKMAEHHASKAGGIAAQLERSIFSDDDDTIEQLEGRIAKLTAERDQAKKVNAAWRKAKKPAADDPAGWERIAEILGCAPDAPIIRQSRLNMARDFCDRAPFPPYISSNLSGRIKADRDRITKIQRAAS